MKERRETRVIRIRMKARIGQDSLEILHSVETVFRSAEGIPTSSSGESVAPDTYVANEQLETEATQVARRTLERCNQQNRVKSGDRGSILLRSRQRLKAAAAWVFTEMVRAIMKCAVEYCKAKFFG